MDQADRLWPAIRAATWSRCALSVGYQYPVTNTAMDRDDRTEDGQDMTDPHVEQAWNERTNVDCWGLGPMPYAYFTD